MRNSLESAPMLAPDVSVACTLSVDHGLVPVIEVESAIARMLQDDEREAELLGGICGLY